jgi:DNA-directed RNA polymerase alpha subunit
MEPDFLEDENLSTRSMNAIRSFNFESKEEVRRAIEIGRFNLSTVNNMGPKSFKEICIWTDLQKD